MYIPEDLKQDFDYKKIGNIIATGSTTIIIEPNKKYNVSKIKNPVLHITKDKIKKEFLKKLFLNTEVEIEDLKTKKLPQATREIIEYLQKQGIIFYYSTKMESYQIDDEELLYGIEAINTNNWDIKYNSKNFDVNDFCDNLKKQVEMRLENETLDKYQELIIDKIKESLKAVKQINKTFKIDLHDEQFCIYKNKVFCIDPVLFTNKECKAPSFSYGDINGQ
jgi:hypothetical protein